MLKKIAGYSSLLKNGGMHSRYLLIVIMVLTIAVNSACMSKMPTPSPETPLTPEPNLPKPPSSTAPAPDESDLEHDALLAAGLVEILFETSGILIDMPYATDDNFMGRAVYPSQRAYGVNDLVERLLTAQGILAEQGYGLKIWDAYRPRHVQWLMWEAVPDSNWVGDPERGSSHNRGAAVDVTLVDAQGQALEMPTPFDHFSPEAHVDYPERTVLAATHLCLLREAMLTAGFRDYSNEWWHFSLPQSIYYPLLDLPLPTSNLAN